LWRDSFETTESAWIHLLLDILRPRSKTLIDIVRQSRAYIGNDVEFDPVAADKLLRDTTAVANLQTLATRLEALSEYSQATTEATIRELAAEAGIKPGVLMGAARVALTGQSSSPGMFDVMVLVGQQRTVERLRGISKINVSREAHPQL